MTIVILLTVLAVFTVVALAGGALGLRESTNTVSKEMRNYTYLMEEIFALKNLLVEMNFETQENISQLNDRFFSSVSTSIDELQSSASQNSNSIRLLKRTTIPRLSSSISDLSISDIYSISTSIRRFSSTSCACPRG
jgi:predicted PurR-regulated permease PerM